MHSITRTAIAECKALRYISKGCRIFQFYVTCIRHATYIGICIIQSSNIDSCDFNWQIFIPSIINLDMYTISKLLQRKWLILQGLQLKGHYYWSGYSFRCESFRGFASGRCSWNHTIILLIMWGLVGTTLGIMKGLATTYCGTALFLSCVI